MKWNVTLRKLLAFALSLVLTLSLTTAAFATEGGDQTPTCTEAEDCTASVHKETCPKYTKAEENPAPISDPAPVKCAVSADCTAAEGHDPLCPKDPAILAVQEKINQLPATAKTQEDLTAAIAAVDDLKKDLTPEQEAKLDTKYYEAAKTELAALTPDNEEKQDEIKQDEVKQDEVKQDEVKQDEIKTDEQVPPPPAEPTPEQKAAELIGKLPAEVTKDNVAEVEKLLAGLAAYNDILTPEQITTRDTYQTNVNTVRAQMNLDHVNELMGKLPEAGTVTAETLTEELAAAYKAQLEEIDNALLALTDEQKDTVENTRYISLANALGSYYEIMEMADAVAQITASDGTVTKYNTLADAFSGVSTGCTIKLLDNVDLAGKTGKLYDNSKTATDVTFDLDGFTLSGKNSTTVLQVAGKNFTITNGTIENYGTGAGIKIGRESLTLGKGLTVKGKYALNMDPGGVSVDVTVTIDGATLVGTTSGVYLEGASTSKQYESGYLILNSGSITGGTEGITTKGTLSCTNANTANVYVTINGGTVSGGNVGISVWGAKNPAYAQPSVTINNGSISGGMYGIAGNGTTDTYHKTNITVNGGTITATNADDSTGIFHPQNGTLTVTGGTISGVTGIEMRSGDLTVSGGTVTGGSGEPTFNPNGSGTTAKNVGIAVTQHTTQNAINVTVNGESAKISGGSALVEADPENNSPTNVKLTVTNGTFTATNDKGKAISVKDTANNSGFISGGTFSTEVDNTYVATNKTTVEDTSGNNIVINATNVAVVNGTGYDSLQDAINDATEGATVKLVKDTTENVTVAADKKITLDLNGKTLSGGTKGSTPAIMNKGELTVTDTSTDKTGTIKREDSGNGGYYVIVNDGTMTFEGGYVYNGTGTPTVWGGASLICNGLNASATMNVNGGKFEQGNFIVFKNEEYGTLNINDGATVISQAQSVQNWNTANINGGNLTGDVIGCAYGTKDSVTEIKGGTINGDVISYWYREGGYATSDGVIPTVNISGGTVTGRLLKESTATGNSDTNTLEPADNAKGDINVSGGTFGAEVPEEYCVENFHPNPIKDENGKVIGYGVHEHKAAAEKQGVVEATCTKKGFTGNVVCSVCGQVMENGTEIPMVEHKYGDWVYQVDDCTKGGTRTQTCSVCGEKKQETVTAGNHPYSTTWNANEAGHWHDCTICDSESTHEAHKFEWVTAVSRDASGGKMQWCSVCGYVAETDWSKLELTVKANRSTVRPGKTITYTLTVTNKTGKDMDEVVVSGDLGKNLTYTKATGEGKYDTKNDLWIIPGLKDGKSAKLTLKVTVKSGVKDGTKLEYTAAITDAEAYNGETYPESTLARGSVTVKVSNKFSLIPETGDTSNIGIWITVLIVAALALIAAVVVFIIKSRKKK